MSKKQMRPPALVTRNGLGDCLARQLDTPEFNARRDNDQSGFALAMIARRFRVHPSTALAHVEAFALGEYR